jgi:hypothetical protein
MANWNDDIILSRRDLFRYGGAGAGYLLLKQLFGGSYEDRAVAGDLPVSPQPHPSVIKSHIKCCPQDPDVFAFTLKGRDGLKAVVARVRDDANTVYAERVWEMERVTTGLFSTFAWDGRKGLPNPTFYLYMYNGRKEPEIRRVELKEGNASEEALCSTDSAPYGFVSSPAGDLWFTRNVDRGKNRVMVLSEGVLTDLDPEFRFIPTVAAWNPSERGPRVLAYATQERNPPYKRGFVVCRHEGGQWRTGFLPVDYGRWDIMNLACMPGEDKVYYARTWDDEKHESPIDPSKKRFTVSQMLCLADLSTGKSEVVEEFRGEVGMEGNIDSISDMGMVTRPAMGRRVFYCYRNDVSCERALGGDGGIYPYESIHSAAPGRHTIDVLGRKAILEKEGWVPGRRSMEGIISFDVSWDGKRIFTSESRLGEERGVYLKMRELYEEFEFEVPGQTLELR